MAWKGNKRRFRKWGSNAETPVRQAVVEKVCEWCYTPFLSAPNGVYCKASCRVQAHRYKLADLPRALAEATGAPLEICNNVVDHFGTVRPGAVLHSFGYVFLGGRVRAWKRL